MGLSVDPWSRKSVGTSSDPCGRKNMSPNIGHCDRKSMGPSADPCNINIISTVLGIDQRPPNYDGYTRKIYAKTF